MRPILLCLAMFGCHAGLLHPAFAEEPLALTVRPSRFEDEATEARARQERLERRLRQAEFAFRSICVSCTPGDRYGSSVPFEPVQVLGGR